MALDMFLKIDSIKGESGDDKHKDEIDVLSWNWGMAQAGTPQPAPGGGAGKATFKDLTIIKRTDRATPVLMLACSSGKHLKQAILTVRKPGEKPLESARITLSDIVVSSFDAATCGEEPVMTEQLTLTFAKVEFAYFLQKPDGTSEAIPPFRWDVKLNKPG
jgi:type VI secretion system secreted protein Hcp